MKKLKVIIVGCGNRGAFAYAKAMKSLPEKFEIIAIADPVKEKREYMRELFDLSEEMCFIDWKDMAKLDKFADIAVIATQDNQHCEPALAFIDKKYDLLLEKPMAPTPEECMKIVREAEKNKVKVLVCHVLRYTPFYMALKKIIDAVVFVNLGSEPKWVKAQVEFIQKACKNADIPFYELEKNLYKDYMERFGNAHVSAVPFWSIGENGKKAKMWRHCTIDYKIATVEKFLKYNLLGYRYLQRIKEEDFQAHEMHIGFSYEESRRVSGKEKSKLFIKQYPLIDMKWERADSYKYILEKWGLETKASACNFCPFHTNYFFNYLKEHDPESYKEVVALDRLIEEKQKDTKIRSKIFVSRSVKRIVNLLPEDCMDAQYFDYNGKKIWNGF